MSRQKSGIADREMKDTGEAEKAVWQQACERYEQLKAEKKLYDFDDLLLCTAELIEGGNVQSGWEKRFRYLLVDEFQDINPIQRRLIQIWHSFGQELFVIGDPDQSIYGFRGADANCFEKLGVEYQDMEVIKLKENYRSSPQIISAAEAVMDRQGSLHPNCPGNVPVRIVQAGKLSGGRHFYCEGDRPHGREAWVCWKPTERRGKTGTERSGASAILLFCTGQTIRRVSWKTVLKKGRNPIYRGRQRRVPSGGILVQGTLCFFRYLRDGGGSGGSSGVCQADLEASVE